MLQSYIASYILWIVTIILGVISFTSGQFVYEINQTEHLLQKYDFLSASAQEYRVHSTNEEFRAGVRDLQYMAGLEETGELDSLTLSRLTGRRCGNIDDVNRTRHRRDDSNVEWTGLGKSELTWAIVQYSSLDYSSETSNFVKAIRDVADIAFGVWAANTSLSFREVKIPDPISAVDIQVHFRTGYHGDSAVFDGEGGALAHAFYPGEKLAGEIHLDDAEPWTLSQQLPPDESKTSLLLVLIHEIGHSLGLRHSNMNDSVMFAWYNEGATQLPTLSDEDQRLISQLYDNTVHTQEPTTTETEMITTTLPTNKPIATGCPSSVDAILMGYDRIFLFKDQLFWSLDSNLEVVDRAEQITKYWYGIPSNFTHIDAVYRNPKADPVTTIFFIGKYYVEFTTNHKTDILRPIADFCLPSSVEKVDAVFVWGHNRMTYIIVGDMYWKFDELHDCDAVSGYPRSVKLVWRGVSLPVDAAFTSFDDSAYFFHKDHYWKFHSRKMRVLNQNSPEKISNLLKCSDTLATDNADTDSSHTPGSTAPYNLFEHIYWLLIMISCSCKL